MKRSLLLFLFSVSLTLSGQILVCEDFMMNSDKFNTIDVERITFFSDSVDIHSTSGNSRSYRIPAVQKMIFEAGTVTGVVPTSSMIDQNHLVYPNPASDNIRLNLSEDQRVNQLIIYDMLGNEVGEYLNFQGSCISIIKLAPGPYFILFNIEEQVYSAKFLKQ